MIESPPIIIVECGVCHDKFISFTSSWRDHEHDGRTDWRACDRTVIAAPSVVPA